MSYGGNGGGSGSIHTSSDVALNNPGDGQVLGYSASLQKWQNQSSTSTRSTTFVIAAANSTASAKAGADYVCAGTSGTGGDEVTINAAINALPSTLSYGPGGRIVLREGDYYLSGAIVNDRDNVTLEGQGHYFGTNLRYVAGTGRQAAIIMGNTRSAQACAVKNLTVYSADGSGNIQAGSGSGIIMRSSIGHVENVTVRSPERDGIRFEGYQTATVGASTTLTSAISTAPPIFTGESWAVSSTASLSTGLATVSSSGTVNDSTFEIINFTVTDSTHIQVNRGAFGTPIQTHSSGDTIQMFTYDSLFECYAGNCRIIYPGIDGMVVDPSVLNSEFYRVIGNGGPNISSKGGRHGIYQKGGDNKFMFCHHYFYTGDGIHCDGWYNGNDGTIIIGGEYESNNNGVYASHNGNKGLLLEGTLLYANTNTHVSLVGSMAIVRNNMFRSASAKHMYINGGYWEIAGNQMHTGGSVFGIEVSCPSPSYGKIHDNYIYGIGSTATAIMIDSTSSYITVYNNTVDRPIKESGGSTDYNQIYNNTLLTSNGSAGNTIQLQGAHSSKWNNVGVSDITDQTANYTAHVCDVVRADATSAGFTITTPASPATPVGEMRFTVIRTDTASANAVTLAANTGQTINGAASATIAAASSSTAPTVRPFYLDGTNWLG